jgi:hypothetical protein
MSQAPVAPQEAVPGSVTRDLSGIVAIVFGVLALAAAFVIFWMPPISIVLGIVAVTLGLRARSRSGTNPANREFAVAAVVLGLVGILAAPAALMIYNSGEDWGRDCAREVSNPDC